MGYWPMIDTPAAGRVGTTFENHHRRHLFGADAGFITGADLFINWGLQVQLL